MYHIFSPFSVRGLTIKNRIFMSPMSQDSADDGTAGIWHLVHYGTRASGGVGLIMLEDTAVVPEGRINVGATGLYKTEHIKPLKAIVDFCHTQGAKVGIQLAHSGPKAWGKTKGQGPLKAVSPSGLPVAVDWAVPDILDKPGLQRIVNAWKQAAEMAVKAGFDCVEIHAAHGYLLHSFLSPLYNRRTDEYGTDRSQLLLEVVRAVRGALPASMPLIIRLSVSVQNSDGLNTEEIGALGSRLGAEGVDVLDLSWIDLPPKQTQEDKHKVLEATRYIKEVSGLAVVLVGLTSGLNDAEFMLESNVCDLVGLGRLLIHDPYWPLHTAETLSVEVECPRQYSVVFGARK